MEKKSSSTFFIPFLHLLEQFRVFFPKLLLLGTDEKRFRREGEDLKEDKDGALLLALVFDEYDIGSLLRQILFEERSSSFCARSYTLLSLTKKRRSKCY